MMEPVFDLVSRRRANRRRQLRARLHEILTRLRLVYAARLKAQRERFPNTRRPCETCAFRTTTDNWQGFDSTVLRFVGALATDSVFYCHDRLDFDHERGWVPALDADGKPDSDRMPPCAAWLALQANPPFDLNEVGIDDETAERLARILLDGCEVPEWA